MFEIPRPPLDAVSTQSARQDVEGRVALPELGLLGQEGGMGMGVGEQTGTF